MTRTYWQDEGYALPGRRARAGDSAAQGEGRGRDNASRERIWFSPGCARPQKTVQLPLLTLDGEATQC